MTRIGLWGRMVDVPGLSSPLPVSTERPDTFQMALSGRRYATRASVSRRQWEWDLVGLDDGGAGKVEQLLHDARRGPLWWMDPTAPSSNMILSGDADPVPSRTLSAVAAAVVDGRTWDMVSGVQSSQVPTVSGVGYRVDVRTSDVSASTLAVETLDAGETVIGTVGAPTEVASTNLFPNPSAEDGVSPWVIFGTTNPVATADATAPHGTSVFKITQDTSGQPQLIMRASDGGPTFAAGETFTVSGWVKADAANTGATPGVQFLVRDSVAAVNLGGNDQTAPVKGEWGRLEATFTVPAGKIGDWLYFGFKPATAGDIFYIDALQAEYASAATPFTPGLTGAGLLSASWTAATEAGVKVTVDGAGWSGVQMVDVAGDPAGWRPGRGCPKVHMSGLDQQLLWALSSGDVRWRDTSVTLTEVDG